MYEVFARIDKHFTGGITGWDDFCKKNLILTKEIQENNETGVVLISFMLDEKGEIKNPEIIQSIGKHADREALMVLNKSKGKWVIKNITKDKETYPLYIEVSISINPIPGEELKPIKEKIASSFENKKYEEALELCNNVLKHQPYNPDFLPGKGILLYNLGKKEEACTVLKRASDLGFKMGEQYFAEYCQ
ncbi:MAG: energy transducer TonB [Flavobacteriales bacterium]|nr:energy transducer TonB [Flavobacteriales bacterium]